MKFSNGYKIFSYIVILGLTGLILCKRFDALISGQSEPADIYIFLVFTALVLFPVFSEIEFFGIKLKKEFENLKNEININVSDIKNEIRNSQSQVINQTIEVFGQPSPDSELPEIEKEIERLVKTKSTVDGIRPENYVKGRIDVSEDNIRLFKVRYNIEKQLRGMWIQRFENSPYVSPKGYQSIIRVVQDLRTLEIIDNNLFNILREIISICNYSIHGGIVTGDQLKFVFDNAKFVLDYLSEL